MFWPAKMLRATLVVPAARQSSSLQYSSAPCCIAAQPTCQDGIGIQADQAGWPAIAKRTVALCFTLRACAIGPPLTRSCGASPRSVVQFALPTASRSSTTPTTSRLTGLKNVRRFGLLAALPISLVAVAAGVVIMSTVHNPDPAAQPIVVPPSSERPAPDPPKAPMAAAPKPPAAPAGIVDRAFIDALRQERVPVPSNEYVTSQGHAVCDFLAHQPDFAEAVQFVQRTSIWDANQSADVTAGAVVSYCPQYKPAGSDQMQQSVQDASSDLQRVEDDLHRIQGDLQGIRDGLPALPGRP
jgi:hypothetical protein